MSNKIQFGSTVGGAIVLYLLTASPAFAVGELFTTGNTILAYVLLIVQQLVNISFVALLLVFFWGLVKFIWGGADDKKLGRNMMVWAVVALFIAASVWGIVRLLQTTFGVGADNTVTIPSANLPGI